LLLPSCEGDGHFTFLGYSTHPNYDPNIHSVRVPIFRNRTYWTVTPTPGMEMDLTQAVVREIEQRTPFKVKQHDADTELLGTIILFTKVPLSITQFNYPREVETTLTVELLWRDVRTGDILSRPARRPGAPLPVDKAVPLLGSELATPPGARPIVVPGTPSLPSGPAVAAAPVGPPVLGPDGKPVLVGPNGKPVVLGPDGKPAFIGPDGLPIIPIVLRSVGHYIPELGQSITTAQQENINRMAVKITEVLEKGW